MSYREQEHDLKPMSGAAYGLAGAGAIALIVGLTAFAAPRPAGALPAYAQQTHLACGRCHVSAAGGGERTAFGKAFAANGHKSPSAAKTGKPGKTGAVDVAHTSGGGSGGGYYSSVTNPGFGSVPEFGYSNSLFFRVDR